MSLSPPKSATGLAVLAALYLFGCEKAADTQESATGETASQPAMPDLPDTTGAALWSYLQEVSYQDNWALWPGKGELYTGQEPHGMLLTTYLNESAFGAINVHSGSMPAGAIIVKENYKADSTLAAATVMYKVRGYNPEHNDWFFAKYLPDGTLEKGPDGVALEGRVSGCQSCHSTRQDNDYIYTAPLGG